jgi:hypothetical protein
VKNVGSLNTVVANWTDRLVLSPDTIYGDLNDIPLGVFTHTGALVPLADYTVTQTAPLPQGIEGDFYLIGMTDSGNAVPEFVLEADNVTISETTFHVTRATYPDLRVEELGVQVTGTSLAVDWKTANRGTRSVTGGFQESLLLRKLTTGTEVTQTDLDFPDPLDSHWWRLVPPPCHCRARTLRGPRGHGCG